MPYSGWKKRCWLDLACGLHIIGYHIQLSTFASTQNYPCLPKKLLLRLLQLPGGLFGPRTWPV